MIQQKINSYENIWKSKKKKKNTDIEGVLEKQVTN